MIKFGGSLFVVGNKKKFRSLIRLWNFSASLEADIRSRRKIGTSSVDDRGIRAVAVLSIMFPMPLAYAHASFARAIATKIGLKLVDIEPLRRMWCVAAVSSAGW